MLFQKYIKNNVFTQKNYKLEEISSVIQTILKGDKEYPYSQELLYQINNYYDKLVGFDLRDTFGEQQLINFLNTGKFSIEITKF